MINKIIKLLFEILLVNLNYYICSIKIYILIINKFKNLF